MASARSPVTPKPAAEFSTLAMTKSSDSRSISAGMARRATSRPGLPKMSPMKRMRMLDANGDPDRGAASLVEPRQHDTQLAIAQAGGGAGRVVRPLEADRPGEPAERALRDVEAGLAILAGGRMLGAGNQQDVLREDDLDVRRRHPGQIEQQLDRGLGLDDVQGGRALGRRRRGVEEPQQVERQIPAFEVDARHGFES